MTKNNRREAVYVFIKSFINEKGYAPSVREIGEGVGLKSNNTVHFHLEKLISEGRIEKDPFGSRTLRLKEKVQMPFTMAPLLGRVTAGIPIFAEEAYEEDFPVPESISKGKDVFVLRVKGDSMINAGIHEGDLVIVEKTEVAENNDIVVALLEDEATVKRLVKKNEGYILMPENSAYDLIEDDFVILGKVISAFKRF